MNSLGLSILVTAGLFGTGASAAPAKPDLKTQVKQLEHKLALVTKEVESLWDYVTTSVDPLPDYPALEVATRLRDRRAPVPNRSAERGR